MQSTDKTNYINGIGKRSKYKKYKKRKGVKVIHNCGGCRAYQYDECILRIPIEPINNDKQVVMHRPVSRKCPKPRTFKQFMKEVKK